MEESLQFAVLREPAAHFDEYKGFHGVRSRRSGRDVFMEISLEFDGDRKMAEVQMVIDRMKTALEKSISPRHISVVPTRKS